MRLCFKEDKKGEGGKEEKEIPVTNDRKYLSDSICSSSIK